MSKQLSTVGAEWAMNDALKSAKKDVEEADDLVDRQIVELGRIRSLGLPTDVAVRLSKWRSPPVRRAPHPALQVSQSASCGHSSLATNQPSTVSATAIPLVLILRLSSIAQMLPA